MAGLVPAIHAGTVRFVAEEAQRRSKFELATK